MKIDSEVGASGGIVTTEEHYGLEVTKDYLEKMSGKDWKIKVYGQRNEGVFTVPEPLSKSFLEKLSCYESGACA